MVGRHQQRRDVRHENGDGWGLSTTYDLGMGFSAGAAYTSSDRTTDQLTILRRW